MPALDLNTKQTAILREYLERVLSDLRVEIAGTDRREYRDEIKAEQKLLQEVFEKLSKIDRPASSIAAAP